MPRKNVFKRNKAKAAGGEQPGGPEGNGAASPVNAPEATAQRGQAPLPLFYKEPRPLQVELHGGKAIKRQIDYRFAASAHAVVLHTREFRSAAASYPIIFTDDAPAMPLAVLGYKVGQNVFVNDAGQWSRGAYIPAYVRRYPFASGQGVKDDELILIIDEASDLVVDSETNDDSQALFVNGQPSAVTEKARDFCFAFQRQAPVTTAFTTEVAKNELLSPKEVTFVLPSGESRVLTGMRVIDEAKFDALPDNVFLDWRRRGWMALVYWHLVSLGNFASLLDRASVLVPTLDTPTS